MNFRDILRKDQTGAFLCGNIDNYMAKEQEIDYKCYSGRIARVQKVKKETEKKLCR